MARRKRKNHVYIVDNKTGGLYYPSEISDNGLEMVDGIFESVEEAAQLLEREAEKYGDQERFMSFDIYKDGQLQREGSEVLTEQAGLDNF